MTDVEEIVSQIEAHIALGDDEWRMDNEEFGALIASWRERGEARERTIDECEKIARKWLVRHEIPPVVADAIAALKQAGEK